jgi:hypothetical protein
METTMNFLQLWQEIYQEAIHLCDAIDSLPDHCECRDAVAHLEGRCPCCRQRKQSNEVRAQAENCTDLLTRLRADMAMLCQDFAQLATPIGTAAIGMKCLQLRRGVFMASEDLHRISKAVDRLQEEVVGFRRTCDLAELRGMKQGGTELREHFNQLNLSLVADRVAEPPETVEEL